METGHTGLGSSPSEPSGSSASHKRPLHSSQRQSGATDNKGPKMGPSLPPIYYSVIRKKLAKMTVRHLDGGACKDDDCTILARQSMTIHRLALSAIQMTKGITIPSTGMITSRSETSALLLIR
jgi:hypothetical protein